jgi:uncharacterized membrane protein
MADSLEDVAAESPGARGRGWLWLAVAAAAFAALIAAYLFVVSVIQGGAPLGCGRGSGCDEVLASSWSRILGLPVGLPAFLMYGTVIHGALWALRSQRGLANAPTWPALSFAAGAIPVAAAWFIGLQAFVLKAFCPWCLSDHALGLAAAVGIACAARAQPVRVLRRSLVVSGALAAGALALVQVMLPSSVGAVARLPIGEDHDTGPGNERVVAVLDGKLAVEIAEVPHLGDPSAKRVLILLYDYCCPHCRQAHGFVVDRLRSQPGEYVVVLLPMPLNAECNRGETETQERFRDSCELARLALAVWRAAPDKFAEYDTWLFTPEEPRSREEARAEAERLVGRELLDTAMMDGWIEARIQADVEAYIAAGLEHIPVFLSPGRSGIVGRTSTAEELWRLIEEPPADGDSTTN